ncbi:MAG: sirohydrochlorin cobaltochelatase [Candidatus Omnitrophota bacterium]|jgi:sirohydrochlorin cobaltochelatase
MSKNIIVLVMHGMPPKDFPIKDKQNMFRLKSKVESPAGNATLVEVDEFNSLDQKMRHWPRTEANDAFESASREIAEELEKSTQDKVIVGYNEFCTPNFDESLDMAVEAGATVVTIVTAMVTRGGSHSDDEIPEAIEAAKKRHPSVEFKYAWPYKSAHIAEFLAQQIKL